MANRRFLLDTNVLLAALIAPERLSSASKERLQDPVSEVFFSAASIWEIAIKSSLGRDDFDFEPKVIQQLAEETGFVEMPSCPNTATTSPGFHGITEIRSTGFWSRKREWKARTC